MWKFVLFLIVAAAMFVAAVSNEVYAVASPPSLGWHIALRKVESIVGFTVVALTAAWWLGGRRNLPGLLIVGTAAYSALIELAQLSRGSTEGWASSVFDVACGAFGGAVADVVVEVRLRSKAERIR